MCPTNWLAAAWGRARRRGHSRRQGRGTCRRRGLARGWILADEALEYLRARPLVDTQRAPQNFFCNISRGSELVSFAVRCVYVTVCATIKQSDPPLSGSRCTSHLRGFGAIASQPLRACKILGRRGYL